MNAWRSKICEVRNGVAVDWLVPLDGNATDGWIHVAILENALDEIEECVLDVSVQKGANLRVCKKSEHIFRINFDKDQVFRASIR